MLRNRSGKAQAVLTVDGQVGFVLEDRDEVVVRRAEKRSSWSASPTVPSIPCCTRS